MARRSYSDEDRANALVALDANGGDVSRTARQLNIPRKTLEEWSKGRVHQDVANVRHDKKISLADRLETVAHQLLDLFPAKAKDANLQQTATAFGIAVDKMRLLRGEPSADELSESERLARLTSFFERIRSQGVGQSATTNGAGPSHN